MDNNSSLHPRSGLGNPQGFPSVWFLQVIYIVGGIACFFCSFLPELDRNAEISCLLLGMLMGAISFGIGLFGYRDDNAPERSKSDVDNEY